LIASFILGCLLSVLGAICIVAGVAIAVVDALRPPAGNLEVTVKDVIKVGEVIRDILRAFGKLKAAAQLLIVGLVLLGGGIALLYAMPF
jgi:hypothetical protein